MTIVELKIIIYCHRDEDGIVASYVIIPFKLLISSNVTIPFKKVIRDENSTAALITLV